MKEFLAGFQVDTENKELAGVCAGLGNYFNIKINVIRLVPFCCFFRNRVWDFNSHPICLSSGLAWERFFRRRGEKSKKSSYYVTCYLFAFGVTWSRGIDSYF